MRAGAFALAAALLVLSAPAASLAMPIPGKLMVIGQDFTQTTVYFMEGDTDNVTPAPPGLFYNGDISPSGTEVAYIMGESDTVVHIWTANIDGSNQVNLTQPAGLLGVNCFARWSPDGSQIAFQHAEPQTDQIPCDAGFHLWIMNADGTGAHPVTTPDFGTTAYPVWMSNGGRLMCESSLGIILINTDGTNVQVLPNVGGSPALSPDGSKIVSSVSEHSDTAQGTYRRLLLTNLDGSNPQVLVERFISDADVVAHLTNIGFTPDDFHIDGMLCNIGPVEPQWAPTGDLVVFSAAMPLDVQGPHYDLQREVWMYSFASGLATQITTNAWSDSGFSWHGDNTYPDRPTVTVDNTTVTFDQVSTHGLTTIVLDQDQPQLPDGYQAAEQFYQIHSTAEAAGPIQVQMTYQDGDLPAGVGESELAMLHYNTAGYWEDVTTSRDPDSNVIYGSTTSLSAFGLGGFVPHSFSDVTPGGYGPHGVDPFWAYAAIDACVAAGIVAGYPGGTYQPANPVTRDQMAVYIARALAGGDDNVPAFTGTPSFSDVGAEHWAFKYIEYAKGANVVTGYADGSYQPDAVVDRGQMAVFVARSQGWVTLGDDMTTAPQVFPDVLTGFWAGTAIKACVDHGVVKGYLDGLYHPSDTVTRDQMAIYVSRAFQLSS